MASNSKNIAELLNGDTTLTATDIANDAVTADKIATGAVVADGLGAGSVTATALGASAVTTAKINAGAVTTAKIADTVNLGRRNLITNGAIQINQRGAFTISTTGSPEYGGPDRFHMWSYTSNEQVTAEISKSTVGGTPTGFANTYRIDVLTAESSVAADEALVFAQYIEAQNCQHLEYGTSDAKSVTMSFWIKTSKTGTYCFYLQSDDGNRIQVKEYTVSSADTWEKKIITIPGDASGTINNDNGRGLWCAWVLMAGTNRQGSKDAWRTTGADYATSNQVNAVDNGANNIYFTGVQLEVGDTATAYEHRSFAEELAACQRYCQVWSEVGDALIFAGKGQGTTQIDFGWPLAVPLRASPTISQTGTGWRAFRPTTNLVSSTATPSVSRFGDKHPFIAMRVGSFPSSSFSNNYSVSIGPHALSKFIFDSEL